MAPRKLLLLPAVATSTLLILGGGALNLVAALPAQADTPVATAPTLPTTLAPTASGTQTATVAAPAASAGAAAPATPAAAGLALSSYDPNSGQAVLKPTANSPAGPAGSAAAVQPGQLIDSPPTPAAPQGALVAVTGVQQAADGTVAVTTRPAALPELLGATKASLQAPLDPASLQVQPQVKDLQVSINLTPTSGQGTIAGGLGLSADTTVPLPNGSTAHLAGSVEIDPTVSFSYQGGVLTPQQARIGFDLGAHADWHISGANLGAGVAFKIPLAKLSSSPVVMVGPLPVVINLDFVLSLDVSADGTVTVDAEQSYDGHWGVHSDYTSAQGWTTTTDPGTSTVSPLKLNLSGSASLKTGLLAEGTIALYDSLGVKASIEPYLRTAVNGTVVLGSGAPSGGGTVDLYGGLDINGALMARLAILGTPILEKDLPFLAYHQEWPITSQSLGQAPTPSVTWTSLNSANADDNRSATLKADWDPYARKATCPDGSRLAGLSYGGDQGLCTSVTRPDLWAADHATEVDHGGTYVSTDWASGYNKAQCPAGYAVTGYSRNGTTMGVLCAKSAAPLGTASRTVWFDSADNRPAAAGGGDFAFGSYKGQCADDEYVAGVAYRTPWWQLWAARPYALLCQKLG
ncbi:hypothetical protein CFP65_7470 [Kitasatospora sp. MMS16-BH015]|uniref:hypothetical protein n=1 Tax=Kitasatospora sp. MMS16-BH015 TaxID=2018025 RepID=UPI000CA0FEC2|nr:hypothetical protein [Kitasatospora sp. MMS16-BH015]AUG82049.1 hypothetical protein CFP65_7470 [Kitasatospora sp. MMS16-BH015]